MRTRTTIWEEARELALTTKNHRGSSATEKSLAFTMSTALLSLEVLLDIREILLSQGKGKTVTEETIRVRL